MKVDRFVKSIKEISYENPSNNYFETPLLGFRIFVVLIFRVPVLYACGRNEASMVFNS